MALQADIREVYHTLRPHPALRLPPKEAQLDSIGDQISDEAAWRELLVESVLSLLLPPEDLENPCLRVLVNEIFAEMIIGNGLSGKACEGWLIWEGITKSLDKAQEQTNEIAEQAESPTVNRLEQLGLISSPETAKEELPTKGAALDLVQLYFWEALRIVILIFVTARTAFSAYSSAALLPYRTGESDDSSSVASAMDRNALNDTKSESSQSSRIDQVAGKQPVLSMSAFSLLCDFSSLSERMPWINSGLSLVHHFLVFGPGKVCETNSRLDR